MSRAPPGGEYLQFSVSHTDEFTIVAVLRGAAIGVDVEDATVDLPWREVAGHFFAPQETRLLETCGQDEGKSRFYAYWTAKEAVLKAAGCGLQGRLDTVVVNFDAREAIGVSFERDGAAGSHRMALKQLWYQDRFLISVCANVAVMEDPVFCEVDEVMSGGCELPGCG